MYPKVTLEKFVKDIIPDYKAVYTFDNQNGKHGLRVVVTEPVNRKQIDTLEKKSDLFLTNITPIKEYYADPPELEVELEFMQI